MSAMTADVVIDNLDGWQTKLVYLNAGVAVDVWYKGGVMYYLAAGRITPVNVAAGLQPAGINTEQITTTAVGQLIPVATGGCWNIDSASPALTDEGVLLSADASAASDNPGDLDTGLSSTGDAGFGFVVKYDSTNTSLWTDIGRKAIAVIS